MAGFPLDSLQPFQIPGLVHLDLGRSDLPRAIVRTPWSEAEVYLHGAHVTGFQKHPEPPLLFVSQASRFTGGIPIRGGIPICFPWFGPRQGGPSHGFARISSWEIAETAEEPKALNRSGLDPKLTERISTSKGQWR